MKKRIPLKNFSLPPAIEQDLSGSAVAVKFGLWAPSALPCPKPLLLPLGTSPFKLLSSVILAHDVEAFSCTRISSIQFYLLILNKTRYSCPSYGLLPNPAPSSGMWKCSFVYSSMFDCPPAENEWKTLMYMHIKRHIKENKKDLSKQHINDPKWVQTSC